MSYLDLLPSKVKAEKVIVSGNTKTKRYVFEAALRDEALSSESTSLKDLHARMGRVQARLRKSNIFDAVNTVLEIDSIDGDEYKAHVKINVIESGVLPTLRATAYGTTGA
jgi:hypothetical protein